MEHNPVTRFFNNPPLSHSEFSARGGRSMSKVKREALKLNAAKARAAKEAKKKEGGKDGNTL